MSVDVEKLPMDSLVVSSSPYRICSAQRWDDEQDADGVLVRSLHEFDLLMPVLVRATAGTAYELIDGGKRIHAARVLGWSTIACQVVSRDIPATGIIDLVVASRRQALYKNTAARARLIRLALELDIARDILCSQLLPQLDLENHPQLLQRLERVSALPPEVLDFCEEKGFSLRQCVHLTRHPQDLLRLLFSWRDVLSLTASLVRELLEHIKDILRAREIEPADFVALPEVMQLLNAKVSEHERTRLLRELVRSMRFPILTEVNQRMERVARSMNLPSTVSLTWDRTLEQRAVILRVNLRDMAQWPEIVKALTGESTSGGMSSLLQEL